MTKLSEVFPSKWLKSEDLKGREVTATIASYSFEDLGDDRKPALWFLKSDKGLILNKTNANRIAIMYGDDLDDWKGKQITLYEEYVEFAGKTVPAIRVKVVRQEGPGSAPQDQQQVETEAADTFDDEIPF